VSNRESVVGLSFRASFGYISLLYFRPTDEAPVKTDIHPDYFAATVKCACGNTFVTRSTSAEIHTDICSNCHPFFTGKQKMIDTAGRVERFRQKYGKPGDAKASA
jgi:large subunit ribosomal protein L31